MIITDKAQIKVASLKESDKLHLTTSDELECYELIESDLKLPADATFIRSSVAYLSDGTEVASEQPRFEDGKFGKGVFIEEGTTNLLQYPNDFDNAVWLKTGTTQVTVTANQAIAPDGTLTADKINITASGVMSRVQQLYSGGIADGNQTNSVWLKASTPKTVRLSTFNNNGVAFGKYIVCALTTDWQRFAVTGGSGNTTKCYIAIGADGTTIPGEFYAWGAQMEAKPYLTSFVDGTRSPETLTIPSNVLNPQEGTIDLTYISNHGTNGSDDHFILSAGIDTISNEFRVEYRTNDRWYLNVGSVVGEYITSLSAGVPVALTVRWDSSTVALFVNGSKVIQINAAFANLQLGNVLAIGSSATNWIWKYQCNGLIDDLRISSRARTDEEIAAAYASGQPLPVDEWTTYKLDFDDKVRITTQGQIICNELIEI